jgi:hypothetical protein
VTRKIWVGVPRPYGMSCSYYQLIIEYGGDIFISFGSIVVKAINESVLYTNTVNELPIVPIPISCSLLKCNFDKLESEIKEKNKSTGTKITTQLRL